MTSIALAVRMNSSADSRAKGMGNITNSAQWLFE
jgi:hypothetical protein